MVKKAEKSHRAKTGKLNLGVVRTEIFGVTSTLDRGECVPLGTYQTQNL